MKSTGSSRNWLQAVAAVSLVAASLSFTSPVPAAFANADDVPLTSTYVSTPPVIDGNIGFGEWNMANRVAFANGFISTVNDGIRLYVLIDATGDTTNDADDYFWLSFDKNRNAAIDANVDLNYGLSGGNIRLQKYLGAGSWTGVSPDTFSSRGKGFGCFFADGSLSLGSPFLFRFRCSQHRVWELAIDLAEIGAAPGGHAKMGARIHSAVPASTDDVPANFYNTFSNLIDVTLAPTPFFSVAPLAGASVGLDANAIELTQAVQDRTNTLSLVAGKTTAARVYAFTANVPIPQSVRYYLYGSQGGVDLPGSPMALKQNAPTVINRNTLNNTGNFQLPSGWNSGAVMFSSKAADTLGHVAASSPFTKTFSPRSVPVMWVVPVNTGTNAAPVLVSNAEIARQESYMKAIYPVRDVTFVQKDWTVLGPTTVNNSIASLNTYYNNVAFAWIITVLFTGKQPYALPDQIYGFTPSGGGLSDPKWAGGQGRVARGFQGTSVEGTMAHEDNHNFDRSAGGTWGRHVPNGCGAAGPDPSWPYANSNINQAGFDTRLPWSSNAVVPSTFPDIMSYCQSGGSPTKWISPYRWTNLFNNFPAPAFTAQDANAVDIVKAIQDVYYISGQLNRDGTGSLQPILHQKGIPTADIQTGDYSIDLVDANNGVISTTPFFSAFQDDPEEPVNTAYFNFQIPVPAQSPGIDVQSVSALPAKVQLKKGAQVLSEIKASANAPTVTITAPTAGQAISGTTTLKWTASDADGDALTFNVLYSPDNGQTWQPVAAGITGNQLNVNTDQLPGGSQAIFRVVATDGFNTTQADSAAFTKAASAPTVQILSPLPNTTGAPGDVVQLEGEASDPGNANLPDTSFVWTEGDNILATGRIGAAMLAPGQHTLTLKVTNGGSQIGESNVSVFVGTKVHLPIVVR